MLLLSPDIIALLIPFAPLFSPPVFRHVQLLVVGAILAPGKRTVTAALRVLGKADDPRFQNFHRVLNRDRWDSRIAAMILVRLLVSAWAPSGPLLFGLDETLERRQGRKIAARGIYRDAARSSKEYLTKAGGRRWICVMLICPIPWAGRVWALPFLTVLAPSERYHQRRRRRHKKLTDWARQMLLQLRRWLPERPLVVVADSSYAVLELLARCQALASPITLITRLRLDARLYDPAPLRKPGTNGRPPVKGPRRPTLSQVLADPQTLWRRVRVDAWYQRGAREVEIATETAVWYHAGKPVVPLRWVLIRDPLGQFAPQALLCTDPEVAAEQVLLWFLQRWQMETTFQAVRTHLGVETQRQWNDQAIARTTPVLLGLFSLVTLMAERLQAREGLAVRQAAWYVKEQPTFADALASVRRELWPSAVSCTSLPEWDRHKLPLLLVERFADVLCYAA
jgi:hypothetical protein